MMDPLLKERESVMVESHAGHTMTPSKDAVVERAEPNDDRPVGYYADEPDWATSPEADAIDPQRLMSLFAKHGVAAHEVSHQGRRQE